MEKSLEEVQKMMYNVIKNGERLWHEKGKGIRKSTRP